MEDPELQGLTPRIFGAIFDRMHGGAGRVSAQGRAGLFLSILELYAEQWRDILARVAEDGGSSTPVRSSSGNSADSSSSTRVGERGRLSADAGVRLEAGPEESGGADQLRGAARVRITNARQLFTLLGAAAALRTQGATRSNAFSSRSHLIFKLTLVQRATPGGNKQEQDIMSSDMFVVDLAGSESAAKSAPAAGHAGGLMESTAPPSSNPALHKHTPQGKAASTFARESAAINTSLAALSRVLRAQAQGQAFVPFRASNLTRLLRGPLGGQANTVVVVAASPSSANRTETRNSLRFGSAARRVRGSVPKNTPSKSGGGAVAGAQTSDVTLDNLTAVRNRATAARDRVRAEVAAGVQADLETQQAVRAQADALDRRMGVPSPVRQQPHAQRRAEDALLMSRGVPASNVPVFGGAVGDGQRPAGGDRGGSPPPSGAHHSGDGIDSGDEAVADPVTAQGMQEQVRSETAGGRGQAALRSSERALRDMLQQAELNEEVVLGGVDGRRQGGGWRGRASRDTPMGRLASSPPSNSALGAPPSKLDQEVSRIQGLIARAEASLAAQAAATQAKEEAAADAAAAAAAAEEEAATARFASAAALQLSSPGGMSLGATHTPGGGGQSSSSGSLVWVGHGEGTRPSALGGLNTPRGGGALEGHAPPRPSRVPAVHHNELGVLVDAPPEFIAEAAVKGLYSCVTVRVPCSPLAVRFRHLGKQSLNGEYVRVGLVVSEVHPASSVAQQLQRGDVIAVGAGQSLLRRPFHDAVAVLKTAAGQLPPPDAPPHHGKPFFVTVYRIGKPQKLPAATSALSAPAPSAAGHRTATGIRSSTGMQPALAQAVPFSGLAALPTARMLSLTPASSRSSSPAPSSGTPLPTEREGGNSQVKSMGPAVRGFIGKRKSGATGTPVVARVSGLLANNGVQSSPPQGGSVSPPTRSHAEMLSAARTAAREMAQSSTAVTRSSPVAGTARPWVQAVDSPTGDSAPAPPHVTAVSDAETWDPSSTAAPPTSSPPQGRVPYSAAMVAHAAAIAAKVAASLTPAAGSIRTDLPVHTHTVQRTSGVCVGNTEVPEDSSPRPQQAPVPAVDPRGGGVHPQHTPVQTAAKPDRVSLWKGVKVGAMPSPAPSRSFASRPAESNFKLKLQQGAPATSAPATSGRQRSQRLQVEAHAPVSAVHPAQASTAGAATVHPPTTPRPDARLLQTLSSVDRAVGVARTRPPPNNAPAAYAPPPSAVEGSSATSSSALSTVPTSVVAASPPSTGYATPVAGASAPGSPAPSLDARGVLTTPLPPGAPAWLKWMTRPPSPHQAPTPADASPQQEELSPTAALQLSGDKAKHSSALEDVQLAREAEVAGLLAELDEELGGAGHPTVVQPQHHQDAVEVPQQPDVPQLVASGSPGAPAAAVQVATPPSTTEGGVASRPASALSPESEGEGLELGAALTRLLGQQGQQGGAAALHVPRSVQAALSRTGTGAGGQVGPYGPATVAAMQSQATQSYAAPAATGGWQGVQGGEYVHSTSTTNPTPAFAQLAGGSLDDASEQEGASPFDASRRAMLEAQARMAATPAPAPKAAAPVAAATPAPAPKAEAPDSQPSLIDRIQAATAGATEPEANLDDGPIDEAPPASEGGTGTRQASVRDTPSPSYMVGMPTINESRERGPSTPLGGALDRSAAFESGETSAASSAVPSPHPGTSAASSAAASPDSSTAVSVLSAQQLLPAELLAQSTGGVSHGSSSAPPAVFDMGGVRSSTATPQHTSSRSNSWEREEDHVTNGAAPPVAPVARDESNTHAGKSTVESQVTLTGDMSAVFAGAASASGGADSDGTVEECSLAYLHATQRALEVLLQAPPMGLKVCSITVDEEDGTPLGAQVEAIHRKSGAFGVLEAGDLLGEVVVHVPGEEDERYDLVDVAYDDIMSLLKNVAKGLKKGVQTTLVAFRPI